MKIGIVQTADAPAEIAAIPDWLDGALAAAAAADLLLLPELALCGYQHQDAVRRLSLPQSGETLRRLAALARGRRQALAFGYAEQCGDERYNAMMAIDAQGNVCANYRKIHLWSGYEQALFRPGDRLAGFQLHGFRFGMAICYDLGFPELVRAQALAGMDCLLCISATTRGYDVVPRHVVPARAYENGCYIAFANRGDGDGPFACIGQSRIVGPDGGIVASAPAAGAFTLSATLDRQSLARWRRQHPWPADSRHAHYLNGLMPAD